MGENENVSSKTIRSILKQADGILSQEQAGHIESKHGKGFRLVIKASSQFENIMDRLSDKGHLPDNSQKRVQYIFELLLSSKAYVILDDLENTLYVSRNTLTADLKEAERLLSSYDIRLKRRPSYGIKATGREFNFRLFIANYILEKDGFSYRANKNRANMIEKITSAVTSFLDEAKITMSDMALHNLIIHIYVTVMHVKEGSYAALGEDALAGFDIRKEYEAAKKLL